MKIVGAKDLRRTAEEIREIRKRAILAGLTIRELIDTGASSSFDPIRLNSGLETKLSTQISALYFLLERSS